MNAAENARAVTAPEAPGPGTGAAAGRGRRGTMSPLTGALVVAAVACALSPALGAQAHKVCGMALVALAVAHLAANRRGIASLVRMSRTEAPARRHLAMGCALVALMVLTVLAATPLAWAPLGGREAAQLAHRVLGVAWVALIAYHGWSRLRRR